MFCQLAQLSGTGEFFCALAREAPQINPISSPQFKHRINFPEIFFLGRDIPSFPVDSENVTSALSIDMIDEFFSSIPSLKICGVTTLRDAERLAKLKVAALGLNFWPSSKRYCSPENASTIASHVAGDILRVGVFVNNSLPLAIELIDECLIDIVQLHGDEVIEDIQFFIDQGIPVIKAVSADKLPNHELPSHDFALLIDTPAGKDYGGTGKTFDWSIAEEFVQKHPKIPTLLAGGINPLNAGKALAAVKPAALDIASGAESSPGIKDFEKVQALMQTLS